MKKLKIILISLIILIVTIGLLRIPLASSVLYFTNLKYKKQITFNFIKEDFIDSSVKMNSGAFVKCGKYLSFYLPSNFKIDPKHNKNSKDDCYLTSSKENKLISVAASTEVWNAKIDAAKQVLFELKKIKSTPYIDKTLADINSSPEIIKQYFKIFESVKNDQHMFSYDENSYVFVATLAINSFSKKTQKKISYQEINNFTVLKNLNYRERGIEEFILFTPDNKVFTVRFNNLSKLEIFSYLKTLLQKDSIIFDEISYKRDEYNQIRQTVKDLDKKGIKVKDLKY